MADPDPNRESESSDYNRVLYVTIVLSILFIATGMWLLPEHCMMVETRNVGFLCDGIDLTRPIEPCPICSHEAGATVARFIFFSGFAIWLLPVFFLKLRDKA